MKDTKQKNPLWFKVLNLTFLLPCIAYPLVLFGSIFLFDNPNNLLLTFLLFIAVNSYPLFFIGIFILNAKLFGKSKMLAIFFSITFCLTCIIFTIQFIG